MQTGRRKFIKLSLSGAFVIGAGGLKVLAGNRFTLPAADDVLLRIVLASDGHYGKSYTFFEQNHNEMVSWINGEAANRGLDLAFINGDLFHNDPAYLTTVKQVWDKLTMPYYVSHGNHDMVDEPQWINTFNNAWHYGFTNKDVAFVVLNTADDKGTYISPDVEKTRQLLHQYADNKNLFVVMHITPFKWKKRKVLHPAIVDLFNNQANLKAVFHGHDHNMDGVQEHAGKFYFFDSHIAGSWGTAYHGYRILEVLKNGNILTYQMNPAGGEKVNSQNL